MCGRSHDDELAAGEARRADAMRPESKTVGEIFDERGPCALMGQVVALAEAHGRIPFGEWDYRFQTDPDWRVCVNGGTSPEWMPTDAPPIKRFECYVEYNGWPAAIFNTVGGCVIGVTEDQIVAAFDKEIHQRGGPMR